MSNGTDVTMKKGSLALIVLVMLGGLRARRSAARFMENFNNSDLKELIDETPQN